jgi:broad specificity phosphatase PhoE
LSRLLFITHPEVEQDPARPVPLWRLSARGIARMRAFAETPEVLGIRSIWASAETKAIEAAGLLAAALGVGVCVDEGLGENDRSATGYLPPPEFQKAADAFFAHPDASFRGWETARAAQQRILAAVARVLAASGPAGDVAILAHGGVGALLLGGVTGQPISRALDQPGGGGGCVLVLHPGPPLALAEGWRVLPG